MYFYKNLSETTKGIILMAIGLILVFYTLGIFTVLLGNILTILGIALIVMGFMRADMYKKVVGFLNKKKLNSDVNKRK